MCLLQSLNLWPQLRSESSTVPGKKMVRPCCKQGRFVKPEAARTNQGGSSFRCQANPQSTSKGSCKQIGGSNAAGFQRGQTKPRFIWPQPSDGKRQEVQLIQLQSVKCYTCILVKRHSKGPFPVFYLGLKVLSR